MDAGGISGSYSNDAVEIELRGGIVEDISLPHINIPEMPSGTSGTWTIDGYDITVDDGIITDIQ